MSSIQTKFISFGEWSPDSVEFDNPALEIAKNVLPVYGAHRPIEKLELRASQADSDPVTAGHPHLASNILPLQRILPIGAPDHVTAETDTGWYSMDSESLFSAARGADEGASLVASFSADDREFAFTNASSNLGNSGTWKAWHLDTPRVIPTAFATEDPRLVFRCAFKGAGLVEGADIEFWLSDDSTDIVGSEASPKKITPIAVDGNFAEYSYTLSDAGGLTEITKLLAADWTKLDIAVRMDSTNIVSDPGGSSPTADVYVGSFRADDGLDTDLYEHIKDDAPAERAWDSYISTWIGKGQSETYICNFGTLPHAFGNVDDFPMTHTSSSNKDNTVVTYELLQVEALGPPEDTGADAESQLVTYGDRDYRVVYTWPDVTVGTDQTTPDVGTITYSSIPFADLNEPDWDQDFYVAITAKYTGVVGGAGEVTASPTGPDPIGGGSSLTGNASDLATDDSNGLTWGQGTATANLVFANQTPATSQSERYVTIKGTAGMSFNSSFFGAVRGGDGTRYRLYQGDPYTIPSSGTLTIPLRNNAELTAHDDLELSIQHSNASGSNNVITFVEYHFYGDAADFRHYESSYQVNVLPSGVAFSHIYLEAEPDVNMNLVDRIDTYVGTKTELYQVFEGSFEVVGRAAGYGDESTDLPRVWDFCSWGDDIIATNYANQPQRKQVLAGVPDALFSDFITTGGAGEGELPYARFCAVVGAQLILGDINPTSYSDGKPFTLWASGILDPEKFYVADYDTQSALYSLIAYGGAITGLVGGEYGIVFKRNSVWRMSYAGLPTGFEFDALSIGQGTPYPQSIVQVDTDVYFWGNGGLFRINGGQTVERISGGRVEKLIFDDKYEDFSLKADYTSDTVLNESYVQGSYDAYTGLVWWWYKGPGDSDHKLSHFITYNPREDRFAHGQIDDANVAISLGRANVSIKEAGINRGTAIITYDGTNAKSNKFMDESNYAAQLKTKIMSPRAFDYDDGREIEIQAVRPIYKSQPDTTFPNFRITVESAQDPNMFRRKQTKVLDNRRIDLDGWLHITKPTIGEFHRFTVDIPTMKNVLVKEFVGLQCKIRAAGDY
jgi:hypothetical protein